MLSQPSIQVLMNDKYQENKNNPSKQPEDYGESDSEVMSGSDAITPLKKKFARLYKVHGTNEERRKWKEEHTKMHQLHVVQPAMHDPRMEMFRRDLMMPRMGIKAEVWETLNREYLRDEAKGRRGEQMESEDDEEDELELDEERDDERDKKASARGSSDVEGSTARKVHNSRKVEIDRQTRKMRDQEEQKNNAKTKATNADFTILGELLRPGGLMSRHKNQPAERREHKRQRLIDNAQVGERVKRVTRLRSSSRTALNTNSTTPFSLKPIPASTLKHHVVPATNNSRFPLPAPTSRTTSSALQPVLEVPPAPPPSNPAPELNLSVIKRQLEDLCSDFRYGRVDVQSALGRFDGVAARIGRFANAILSNTEGPT
ncbi:hypothetical protein V5O48_015498 [Marasmius crinis-equi]|uniref:Uncharacterized protein n=1 Tax=Marasmius crinis-equi TaxID=585013 RepID=A0ABR3EUD2_9AGAR